MGKLLDIKCPHCGAWAVVKESYANSRGVARTLVCGNEHEFKDLERHKMPPRQKPPQASFKTPQAERRKLAP
jgi:hypothetical protein